MKKLLPVLTLSLCAMLVNCKQKRNEFDIYPLSPYSDVVKITKDDIGSSTPTVIVTRYYLVDESTDYTENTKNRLQNYIETKLRSNITGNKSIYFTFYKGRLAFNKNSTQTKSELVTKHAKDKLAEFEYVDGKFYDFDFYKDGTYFTPSVETREREVRGK